MSEERPVPENGIMSTDEQALLLVQTEDHTHPDEEQKLAEEFGAPDARGVYSGPEDPTEDGGPHA